MDVYEKLGVRKVVNGYATLTRLGGSIMPPPVVEAMVEASKSFVSIEDLQDKVGRRLAELTRNEAAFVSCGAAAGLLLATAACITGKERVKIAALPNLAGMKDEVIVHRTHRNGYDFAIRQTGAKIVEIGVFWGTQPWELEAAINQKTAAIFYFAGEHFKRGALPLEKVISIAKVHGVPVVVDAAAQIPPVESLWKFTQMGADLAIFSGGKGLQGPQASGLIVGRRDLIEAIAANANPNTYIGRPAKVGKEEMIGLLAAVEWYLGLDQAALLAQYERQVKYLLDEFSGLAHIKTERGWPSEAGQPMPLALIHFLPGLKITRDQVIEQLKQGDPYIEVAPNGEDAIAVNPQTLSAGEDRLIAARLKEILGKQPGTGG